jgi:hypothetical protein
MESMKSKARRWIVLISNPFSPTVNPFPISSNELSLLQLTWDQPFLRCSQGLWSKRLRMPGRRQWLLLVPTRSRRSKTLSPAIVVERQLLMTTNVLSIPKVITPGDSAVHAFSWPSLVPPEETKVGASRRNPKVSLLCMTRRWTPRQAKKACPCPTPLSLICCYPWMSITRKHCIHISG